MADESSGTEESLQRAGEGEELIIDDAECDAIIAGLLERIDELERQLQELRDEHERHTADYRHERIHSGDDGHRRDEQPEPSHWYFRRIGRA